MSIFTWGKKVVPTESDKFRESLPRSPLTEHLTSLHVLFNHVDKEHDPNVRAAVEQTLREIAVFTADRYNPYGLPPAQVANPVRIIRNNDRKKEIQK